MTQPKTNRIPAPLYAAAGVGELAYQQLRKVPTVVTELGGKAVVSGFELREKAVETLRTANTTAVHLREKTVAPVEALDLDRLREVAARNAATVLATAQAAQERALAAYGALVARGERVVGSGVVQAADTVNADIETTEATLATPTAASTTASTEVAATPATVAEVVEKKPAPAKATRTRTRATRSTAKSAAQSDDATPSAKLPKPAKRTRPTAG